MPKFSQRSLNRLSTCHPKLITLFTEIIKKRDCSILCGHRGKEEQNAAYKAGNSKLKYPKGKHNKQPSLAVDAIPYPFMEKDWWDLPKLYAFGGYVKGVADSLGIRIRWGGDWDSDWDFRDQSFNDLPHFELLKA